MRRAAVRNWRLAILDKGVPGPRFPLRLPTELHTAFLRLHGAGPEGKGLSHYLGEKNPHFWLNPFFIRPGGGLALVLPLVGRLLCLNTRGLDSDFQAALLAHEAMHLRQDDEHHNWVSSQADEVQAYQVQGQVLNALGRGEGFLWSSDAAQRYAPTQAEALALLLRTWPLYAAWPVTRPHGLRRLVVAGARQAIGALRYAIAEWRRASRGTNTDTHR